MSADKHKKRDRAFGWLRKQRRRGEPVETYFSKRHKSALGPIAWLVKNGFGEVKRRYYSSSMNGLYKLRRNYFIEK